MSYPPEVVREVIDRNEGYCPWCQLPLLEGEGVMHHRRLKDRQNNTAGNLVYLHPRCHNGYSGAVHMQPALATRRGFIVRWPTDPATVPIGKRQPK